MKNHKVIFTFLTLCLLLSMVLGACTSGGAGTAEPTSGAPVKEQAPTTAPVVPTTAPVEPTTAPVEPTTAPIVPTTAPAVEEAFDLDALIAAAQAEGELVAYWHSSRIEKAGLAFEEKYGIKVIGTKMNNSEQTERVIREVQSGNVQVDLIGYDDGGTLITQMIPQNIVSSWVPPDLAGIIPAEDRDPLIYLWQPRFLGYNTEVYGDVCPIENMWQLTEEDWNGKVIIRDPQVTTAQLAWFASIIEQPDLMAQAYKDRYGEELVTEEKNAGWEFLKRLFANNMQLMGSDDDVAQAVGGAGQTDPPVGFYTYAKHRNMEELNLKLGMCKTMKPFMGYALPTYVAQVTGSPHPNAAKLFTHYVLTEEGVKPWALADLGGYSPNPEVSANPADEVGVWADWKPLLFSFDPAKAIAIRQDLLDYWLTMSK